MNFHGRSPLAILRALALLFFEGPLFHPDESGQTRCSVPWTKAGRTVPRNGATGFLWGIGPRSLRRLFIGAVP